MIWNNQCAICGNMDFLEFHHLIPKNQGGTDDYGIGKILPLFRCRLFDHRCFHGAVLLPSKMDTAPLFRAGLCLLGIAVT